MISTVGASRFWNLLWREYPALPSVVLCRVPELEYASTLDVSGKTLDHCCGDGRFASLAWDGHALTAGCDIDQRAVRRAGKQGVHTRLDTCDVARCLPYSDASFNLIFNNSALEHLADLDSALAHVARTLAPGGTFAFNVLNHRYFEWWPLDEESKISYRRWQPFIHALDLAAWEKRLIKVGCRIVGVEGYFDRRAARELAWLDCKFSGASLGSRRSLLVSWNRRFPRLMQSYWRWRLSPLVWKTETDAGAGYFIQAVRNG